MPRPFSIRCSHFELRHSQFEILPLIPKLNTLRQRQLRAPVDRVRLSAHVGLPRVAARLATAAGFFLTSIALTILARNTSNSESKIDQIKVEGQKDPGTVLDTDKAPEAKKPEGPVVPKPE